MPIIPTSKPFVPYRKKQTPPAICRALLIGITYGTVRCNGYEPLRGPAIDAHAMEDLLLRKYLFKKADVVVMTDEEVNQGTHLWPTRQNILKEIDRLVYGARAGDNFVFHYAGHAGQTRATVDQREEDGLDEYLIACDYERILNDDLRRLLVDRLPRGTRLTAIFDACHSGTLLDLDHYHCDQHVQRSKSETDLQRKVPMLSDAQNRFSADVNCFRISSAGVKLFKAKLPPVMIVAWMSVSLMRTVKKKAIRSPTHTEAKSDTHLISRCRRRHCEFSLEDGPSVISVSACADHQINWEGGQRGKAMTSLLIEILDRNPSVNVGALGETLRRDLFRAGCSRIRDFLSWKRGHPLTVLQNKTLEEGWRALRDDEMPQFGSLTRLRKDKPFLVPRQLTPCYCTSPEPGVDHIHRHVSRIPRPMTSSSRFRPQRSPFPHHLVSLIHLLEQSYSARISGIKFHLALYLHFLFTHTLLTFIRISLKRDDGRCFTPSTFRMNTIR